MSTLALAFVVGAVVGASVAVMYVRWRTGRALTILQACIDVNLQRLEHAVQNELQREREKDHECPTLN
jgi:hypothetical protein